MNQSGPLVEFLRPDGKPVLPLDLGFAYLEKHSIGEALWERPLRFTAEARKTRSGKSAYRYEAGGLSLPDRFETRIRIGAADVGFGPERLSSKGNVTREGNARFTFLDIHYSARAYLTSGRTGFWVSVDAYESPVAENTSKSEPPNASDDAPRDSSSRQLPTGATT